MKLLAKLERTFGRFAIQDLTLYLMCGQAGFLIMYLAQPRILQSIWLEPARVLDGEVWRLVTFPFFPPTTNVLFAIFALYLFLLMGRALESHWGTFRYNLYMLIAYLASVGGAFLSYALGHNDVATSAYFDASVFLAFAMLFPEFTIMLFFILPVQIKWLALITWIFYGWSFLVGDTMTRLLVAASVLNFLLFFARDIVQLARTGRRRMQRQIKSAATTAGDDDAPFHTCAACGITDKSHPKMEFRYCPDCGGLGYCIDHIHNHQHRRTPVTPQ